MSRLETRLVKLENRAGRGFVSPIIYYRVMQRDTDGEWSAKVDTALIPGGPNGALDLLTRERGECEADFRLRVEMALESMMKLENSK